MKANKVRIKLNFRTYSTMDSIIFLCLNLLPVFIENSIVKQIQSSKENKIKRFLYMTGQEKTFQKFSLAKLLNNVCLIFGETCCLLFYSFLPGLFTLHTQMVLRQKTIMWKLI